jgi:hypothetical protein
VRNGFYWLAFRRSTAETGRRHQPTFTRSRRSSAPPPDRHSEDTDRHRLQDGEARWTAQWRGRRAPARSSSRSDALGSSRALPEDVG